MAEKILLSHVGDRARDRERIRQPAHSSSTIAMADSPHETPQVFTTGRLGGTRPCVSASQTVSAERITDSGERSAPGHSGGTPRALISGWTSKPPGSFVVSARARFLPTRWSTTGSWTPRSTASWPTGRVRTLRELHRSTPPSSHVHTYTSREVPFQRRTADSGPVTPLSQSAGRLYPATFPSTTTGP